MTHRLSRRITAAAVIFVFSFFAFNAYACLVPVFGHESMGGVNCSLLDEQPAKQFCDSFTSLANQAKGDDLRSLPLTLFLAAVVLEDPRYPAENSIKAQFQPGPVKAEPLYTLHRALLI